MMATCKLSKSYTPWVRYFDKDGKEKFVVASDTTRTKWSLFAVKNGIAEKIKTGKSPKDFEKEIF
ncbi:MAG: hypothetical protein KBS59_00325 [Clostridiales bacterium]|nr:hypothetical protein [Clostridiales bacterium]